MSSLTVNVNEVEESPQCSKIILTNKLVDITSCLRSESIDDRYSQITVLLNFEITPKRPKINVIKELIKDLNPNTIAYLEKNKIEYIPLGSSGSVIANPTLKQLNDLKEMDEIREIDYALHNINVYSKSFKKI